MTVRNLGRIFRPQQVAVVGASDRVGKVGHTVLANVIGSGFRGVVYPVNLTRESVQGIQAYPRVADLPKPPDLAVICTPAETVADLVWECGQAGIRGVAVVAAGFREEGEAGAALEARLLAELRRFDGLRMLGPNCLGFIAPHLGLNASFVTGMPKPGRVAFVSQSGALCTTVLDWAIEEELGFSYFISIGNMLDVGIGDVLDYLAADPHTDSVVLYVESIREARGFMSAARAIARRKPVVVYKAGRFAESARAAASHTGALAGEDAVYDAVFERAGMVRVFDIEDLYDCAELLSRQRVPRGPRLAIVTNADGPGVMATDALIQAHGTLASLSEQTLAGLNAFLPGWCSRRRP